MNSLKVSVVCVTYNQEKYIAQALDSFLEQKTDFKFEVLVADDNSTDSTPQIIKKYAKKYPSLIKPVFRKKNIGVTKNFTETMRLSRADYVALCEGDDYWTDIHKLQIQADYMDKHKNCALSFHAVGVFFENGDGQDYVFPEHLKKIDTAELIKRNFIQTNSVMYRRQNYDYTPPDMLPVDWYLHLYHAQFGDIGFIDKVMAKYRRHSGGVWWDSKNNLKMIWKKYGLLHLELYRQMKKLFQDKSDYTSIIDKNIFELFSNVYAIGEPSLSADMIIKFPEFTLLYLDGISAQYEQTKKKLEAQNEQTKKDLEALLQKRDNQIQELMQYKHSLEAENNERQILINKIHRSRLWRLRNKYAKLTSKETL
jgi:glycosyltransferase involved in cell wall biosynthesis